MSIAAKTNLKPRASTRTRVIMKGIVFTPQGALHVRVRDVSSTGARVMAEVPILSDCDVIFKKGSLFVAARVAWSRNREAGLTFYRELRPQDTAEMFQSVVQSAR